jgi:hypothetical protein
MGVGAIVGTGVGVDVGVGVKVGVTVGEGVTVGPSICPGPHPKRRMLITTIPTTMKFTLFILFLQCRFYLQMMIVKKIFQNQVISFLDIFLMNIEMSLASKINYYKFSSPAIV